MASMKIYNRYGDNLARERRRRFFIRLAAAVFIGVMVGGISAYALFYSGWLDVNSISMNGLKSVTEDQVSPTIRSIIEDSILPVINLRFRKNIIFFDSESVEEAILAQFPEIKKVEITKELPHKIIVNISERLALGTWCMNQGCRYFDEDGVLWGKSLRSSGSLLLNVEDLRPVEERLEIDGRILGGIKEAISELNDVGVKINKIEIPADYIGQFRIYTTRGYYLILDMESDIKNQINTLRILLKEKGADFSPQYIDLRVEGRAYYR